MNIDYILKQRLRGISKPFVLSVSNILSERNKVV